MTSSNISQLKLLTSVTAKGMSVILASRSSNSPFNSLSANRRLFSSTKSKTVSGLQDRFTRPAVHSLNETSSLSELIKAANHLLGTFEPGLLWDWLSDQLKSKPEDMGGNKEDPNPLFVPSSAPDFEEVLSLTDFLLEIVSFVSVAILLFFIVNLSLSSKFSSQLNHKSKLFILLICT